MLRPAFALAKNDALQGNRNRPKVFSTTGLTVALGGRATSGWCLFGDSCPGPGWLRYPGFFPRRLASLIDLAGPSGPAPLSGPRGSRMSRYQPAPGRQGNGPAARGRPRHGSGARSGGVRAAAHDAGRREGLRPATNLQESRHAPRVCGRHGRNIDRYSVSIYNKQLFWLK